MIGMNASWQSAAMSRICQGLLRGKRVYRKYHRRSLYEKQVGARVGLQGPDARLKWIKDLI